MRFTTFFLAACLLGADSATLYSKAEEKWNREYSKAALELKQAQVRYQKMLDAKIADCKSKGQGLQGDGLGFPVCVTQPPQPTPQAPAKPTP